MSTPRPEYDEPRRRVIWLFDAGDEAELAQLTASGWRVVTRQTLGGRVRVSLVERRTATVEAQPAPGRGRPPGGSNRR